MHTFKKKKSVGQKDDMRFLTLVTGNFHGILHHVLDAQRQSMVIGTLALLRIFSLLCKQRSSPGGYGRGWCFDKKQQKFPTFHVPFKNVLQWKCSMLTIYYPMFKTKMFKTKMYKMDMSKTELSKTEISKMDMSKM